MLVGWLTWQQQTVELKCADLTEEDAHRAPIKTSPQMTIAALVSHLTAVERDWLEGSFLGRAELLTDDQAGGWDVTGRPLHQIVESYRRRAARSRQIIESHQLEQLEAFAPPGMQLVSLRWIVTHLIEETGRHLGHLDLLRELSDGSRGQ
jgi:uncharacterized damage-inducible protein DinB